MYGRQSEIQRIQSKLQRIGQSNPYRAAAWSQSAPTHESNLGPSNQEGAALFSVPEPSETEAEESLNSTCDRDTTSVGPQPSEDIEKGLEQTEQPHPLPDAVTFFPQQSWPQQIQPVTHEIQQNSYQLADALRHPFYPPPLEQETETGHGQPARPRFTIAQGIVWLVGAMVVRVGIDRLLLLFPHLWIVMAAIVLTPVAIALYQTAVSPQSTVHSGRRLLVIMVGLLIGGQL